MNFNPALPYNELPILPPNFNFEDIDILKKLNVANLALSKLDNISVSIPNADIFIEPLSIREAVASSEIENINTTVEEVFQASLLEYGKISKAQKETLYYKEALLHGYNNIKLFGFISTNNIIEIQSILEPERCGIRKLPGTKIQNTLTNEIIFTPPVGEENIRNLLSNLEKYINQLDDDVDPLIKLAVIHSQFESIHPFYDGNGRTGRILMVLYLILVGRLQFPILYLSGYINKNRSDYYRLLRDVTTNNNWKDWTLFILTTIEEQAKITLESMNTIRLLMNEYSHILQNSELKLISNSLNNYLFSRPFYNIKTICLSLNITRNTASKYFNQLLNLGLIENFKIKNISVFYNPRLLEILK